MKGYTITDAGKVRSENQDCVRLILNTLPSYGVLALCDGMGGANAGSVASDIALGAFTAEITENLAARKSKADIQELIVSAAEKANRLVYEKGCSDASCAGMGTTLVAAVVKGKTCCVANIGDSRAYLISGSGITQITHDHSFVEDMVKRGSITREQARNHPRKNVITRALGVEPTVQCDVFTPEFKRGEALLLCSDGLSNTLSDAEIFDTVRNCKNLADIGRELLDLALSRGAPDNVTVGLLRK